MKLIILMTIITIVSSLETNKTKKTHPKLVIFNLDNTLWPSWKANKVIPPFLLENLSKDVIDQKSNIIEPFKDVLAIFTIIQYNHMSIAIASNDTANPKHVNQLIKFFSWDKFFINKQIYPGPIKEHLKKIKEECKIDYEDMLHFSSEENSIFAGNRLNILSFYIEKGMKMSRFLNGMRRFSNLKKILLDSSTDRYVLKDINNDDI